MRRMILGPFHIDCPCSGPHRPSIVVMSSRQCAGHPARLAQSVEHETLNLRVVGSSPTLGGFIFSNLILSSQMR